MAAARAVESRRPDRLFDDPYAERLAGPEGFALLASMPRAGPPPPPGQSPESPYLAIRTRFIDDWLARELADPAVRQVVMLAAGLDVRAYRLALPPELALFELDRPEVLSFKERELSALSARAACRRVAIPVDLTVPFGPALVSAGFEPSRPALWLIEGLLPYLEEREARGLLSEIAPLAAAGSRLVGDVPGASFMHSPHTEELHRRLRELGAPWKFGTDDPEGWLAASGWQARAVRPGERGASYHRWPHRMVPRNTPGVPQAFFITASRIPESAT